MAVTYNKDGTPRKQGSGRRKGSTSTISVTWAELKEAGFNDDDPVVLGRKWWENRSEYKATSKQKVVDNAEQNAHTSPSAADAVANKIAYTLHKN